ncbi:hypothetical protein Nepgr_007278 [Nepenthes gracilis]|uniref:Uncharacterized protein n=1 Tax=Nepenthes gracilis TaxID=150966 RepID=A0AAD3S6R8_NEPGR|nr:hypothetical protein Nepgr_007278 [Nepenthes gracilis]
METLISQLSSPHFLLKFPSLSYKNRKFNFFLCRKCLSIPINPSISLIRASPTANSTLYNGWDDPRLHVNSEDLGESNQVQSFLISLGIDNKKYMFMYILGFSCALAISRIRVSSIIVFPATAIIFAIGFSFGFVNGEPSKKLNSVGATRRTKDGFRVYRDKLKNLAEILDGLDVKVDELKNDIKKSLDCKRVVVADLEGYVSVVESIGSCVLNGRNIVHDCINCVLSEDIEMERNSNQKSDRGKKEIVHNGFDMFQLMWKFVGGNAAAVYPNKKKDVARNEYGIKNVGKAAQEHSFGSIAEDRASYSKSDNDSRKLNLEDPCDSSSNQCLSWNGKSTLGDRSDKEMNRVLNSVKMNCMEQDERAKSFANEEEINYLSNMLKFMDTQRVTSKMSEYNGVGNSASLHDNLDFNISMKHMETEASLRHEKLRGNSNGFFQSFEGREKVEHRTYGASSREESMDANSYLHASDYTSKHEGIASTSSSMFSDDLLFNRYLTESNSLLKQAKERLKASDGKIHAEKMLLECSKLLSKAIAMKPMSLLAMGQLGNTYLLHGELKLSVSRELRSLLSRGYKLSSGKETDELISLGEPLPNRDRIATLLINVCEECEGLLVEAGRRYRMALSIDGNDVRALYNWGLALSFRAQLIADIGPDAALDADKLFLAAIDKFDAMMSRSNIHAPDALFRWGAVLQQRSRLRPSTSKDRMKLLQQAKRLYEDAIEMGSDNLQVQEALSLCLFELNSRRV